VYAAKHATADSISGFGVDKIYAELLKDVEDRLPEHVQLLPMRGKEPFFKWEQKSYDTKDLKKSINEKNI